MADEIRTIAALQTLLADNSNGDISAQDVRDMLVSLAGGQTGYADYPDVATTTTPITLAAGVWTDLTNDKAGSFAREDLPIGVTSLFNSSTNKLDFSELPLDTFIDLRIDINVITATANTDIDMRVSLAEGHAGAFQVPLMGTVAIKSSGNHAFPTEKQFYIGPNMNTNPGAIQIRAEKAATCIVNGWVQFIHMRGKKL